MILSLKQWKISLNLKLQQHGSTTTSLIMGTLGRAALTLGGHGN